MRDRVISVLTLLVLVVLLGETLAPAPIGAATAVQQADDVARIDTPLAGSRVSGRVEIQGRASPRDPTRFQFYRVYYGAGAASSTLRPIGSPGDRPVEGGLLATWDTATVTPGEYQLLLTVYDSTSRPIANASVVVTVDPTPAPADRPTMAPYFVVTPGEVPPPGAEGEEGPPPTPIPELPQLNPNIPRIDVPPPRPGPPIPNLAPTGSDSPIQPIQPIVPIPAPNIPPPPAPPPPGPLTAPPGPSLDPGPSGAPSINAPAPPPPPVIRPYEPPVPPTVAPPTPFGLPP